MSTLASLGALMGNPLYFLLSFLLVLTVVVFVHELGHFLVARWCGVKVSTFSIGFGREIFGFNDRHGTRWRFAWIPLGGYVKFMDDANAASVPGGGHAEMTSEERAGSFHHKPLWRRAAVVAAGPIANFLFAIVIFACMFSFLGQQTTIARVDEVVKGMPADLAGFQSGDIIKSMGGRDIESFSDVLRIVSASPGRTLDVVVERGGVEKKLTVTPKSQTMNDRIGGTVRRGLIGIKRQPTGPEDYVHRRAGPLEAVALGVKETEYIITSTLSYLADVVVGRQPPDQLGGVIRIADVSGKVAQHGGVSGLIHLIAVLSISVGLINLFPIPLLDGGHLLFYAIEAVRGRPLSESSQELGFKVGFALVLSLMLFATWNDRGVVARWLDIKTEQNQAQ